ncbi:hypothetical protein [Psychroflexus sp. ALD_RP9]|uniref:hypothetical protein n=1 Tax=Psychroflexus sp. ALD_RP9 TaxID=2777186 RepID=UPI001A8C5DF3|nr:hypothetical protein [Psychroflexus sp. ALD_RP9]QSS96603.1 hypothetical protein IMZ30_09130 [Psychroflexus sp. ALD_RP9]
MRATKYFRNATDMAQYAKEWAQKSPLHWYLRTNLRCDHVHHEKRKSIVLIERETLVRKLITCSVCNNHGNSLEIEKEVERLKAQDNAR